MEAAAPKAGIGGFAKGLVPAEWIGAADPLGSWSPWRPHDLQPRQRLGFQLVRRGRAFCLAQVLAAVLTGGQPRETDYTDYSDRGGSVPTSVRLDPAIEARLDQLVAVTGRSKAYYLRELIEQGIDDLEDAYLGAAVLERIRSGKEQTFSLNDVMTELDLDASDL